MKRFTITGEWQGSRLDRFIRASFPGMPFGVIQILLRKGLIYLNGDKAIGNVRLRAGDVVAINIAEAEENGTTRDESAPRAPVRKAARKRSRASPSRAAPPGSGPASAGEIGKGIPILYEDDSLLVLDKPAGLVVQPGNRKERGSLLDLLEEYRLRSTARRSSSVEHRGETPPSISPDEPSFRFTPVHRLDRETSGALIVAKTRAAARSISRFVAEGLLVKTYLAVVEGVPSPRSGEISTPLATSKGRSSHSSPDPEGKKAVTRYTVVAPLPDDRALLQVSIRSGRTHQIRAHLGSIGHPVVGDEEYGAPPGHPGRFLLHAWKIEFPHPASGTTLVVEAQPPEEFRIK